MLYITNEAVKIESHLEWHVGEPVPPMVSNVITFQADGTELDVIVEALRNTREGGKQDQNKTQVRKELKIKLLECLLLIAEAGEGELG